MVENKLSKNIDVFHQKYTLDMVPYVTSQISMVTWPGGRGTDFEVRLEDWHENVHISANFQPIVLKFEIGANWTLIYKNLHRTQLLFTSR